MADQDTVSFKKLLKKTHFLTQISFFAFSKMAQKRLKLRKKTIIGLKFYTFFHVSGHSARSSPALTTSSSATSSLIKLEHPEVDSSTNNTSSSSMTTTTTTILHQNSSSNTNFRSSAADELPVCIANPDGASMCRGDMLNLNKLTCYLDLITRKVVKDDGASAMERAIIKSRMKIPFWSADEVSCVFGPEENDRLKYNQHIFSFILF